MFFPFGSNILSKYMTICYVMCINTYTLWCGTDWTGLRCHSPSLWRKNRGPLRTIVLGKMLNARKLSQVISAPFFVFNLWSMVPFCYCQFLSSRYLPPLMTLGCMCSFLLDYHVKFYYVVVLFYVLYSYCHAIFFFLDAFEASVQSCVGSFNTVGCA